MTIFLLVIAIGLFFVILNALRKRKKPEPKPETILATDEGLTLLKVYCCGGEELEQNQTKVVKGEMDFFVKGFNQAGKELTLKPKLITWQCSCACVKFASATGPTNEIYSTIQGDIVRKIWVRYNTKSFTWRMQFIK